MITQAPSTPGQAQREQRAQRRLGFVVSLWPLLLPAVRVPVEHPESRRYNRFDMTKDSDILQQIIAPSKGGFSPEHARFVLSLKFAPSMRAKYLKLSEKAQLGRLRPAEQYELDNLLDANSMLVILKSKARVSLRKHGFAA